MFSPSRKRRKTGSEPCTGQVEVEHRDREVELEPVHKGAVANACSHTLDMGSLLYSLDRLLAGEEILSDMSTTKSESERLLTVSRASSVEEFERGEDKLVGGRKSSEKELQAIEDGQEVASGGSVVPTSASSSFFHRGASFFAHSFEATQGRYGSQSLSRSRTEKVTGIIANHPQNH